MFFLGQSFRSLFTNTGVLQAAENNRSQGLRGVDGVKSHINLQ